MKKVLDIIKTNYYDKTSVFVFPSEIAAAWWRKKLFDLIDTDIVIANRFISWDRFKETCLVYPGNRQPVNHAKRLLFLNYFLEKNRNGMLLKAIIPAVYAGNSQSFTNKFLKILPMLYQLDKKAFTLQMSVDFFEKEKYDDLLVLKKEYLTFLDTYKLYEPNYESPNIEPGDNRYYIFFPEILNDYSYLMTIPKDYKQIIPVYNEHPEENRQLVLNIFESSLNEFDYLLENVTDLLDQGVEPGSIAITVCNLPELEEFIKNWGMIHEVPLYIHSGKALLSYNEIRFLNYIQECYSDRYSFASLKNLLLNKAVPWKNTQVIQALVEIGIRYKFVKSLDIETWTTNLARAGNDRNESYFQYIGGIRKFIFDLKKYIVKIMGSATFEDMKKNLILFVSYFFNEDAWEPQSAKVFQFAINTIDELIAAHREVDNAPLTNIFRLWQTYLKEKQYVKQSLSNRIPVYPYRVSAGSIPEYHFIINTSQQAVKYIINNYPFLNINEQELFNDFQTDLSGEYLRLYQDSGVCVFFSCSRKSFHDSNLIPGYFINQAQLNYIKNKDYPSNFYANEDLYWKNLNCELFKINSIQHQSFIRAVTTHFTSKKNDYTKQPVSNKNILNGLIMGMTKDQYISVSATHLETYLSCPFNFLLSHGLQIQEDDYDIFFMDNLLIGRIMHKIFQLFFNKLAMQKTGLLSSMSTEQSHALMNKTASEVLDEYEKCNPTPFYLLWEHLKLKSRLYADLFVDVELESFGDYTLVCTEEWIERIWEHEKIKLTGRIDRLSLKGDEIALIDYKKNHCPSKNQIFSDERTSFQMPIYIYLSGEKYQKPVTTAAYYSIQKAKYDFVLAGFPVQRKMAEKEAMDAVIEQTKKIILEFVSGIKQGNFLLPDNDNPADCLYCIFRGVCRSKYITG